MSYGVGGRHGLDPELMWLWCRSAAEAPIQSLAWELSYTMGVALKKGRGEKCPTFHFSTTGIFCHKHVLL